MCCGLVGLSASATRLLCLSYSQRQGQTSTLTRNYLSDYLTNHIVVTYLLLHLISVESIIDLKFASAVQHLKNSSLFGSIIAARHWGVSSVCHAFNGRKVFNQHSLV